MERWKLWICRECGNIADQKATKPLACDVLHGPDHQTELVEVIPASAATQLATQLANAKARIAELEGGAGV